MPINFEIMFLMISIHFFVEIVSIIHWGHIQIFEIAIGVDGSIAGSTISVGRIIQGRLHIHIVGVRQLRRFRFLMPTSSCLSPC